MAELLNSTDCAKELTKRLNRSVKREFISKLAKEERLSYHIISGKKYFDPLVVARELPPERTTSVDNYEKKIQHKILNLTQYDVIEHFKSNGLNIDYEGREDDYKQNCLISLPKILLPTVDEVKEQLFKDYEEELKDVENDNVLKAIENTMKDFTPNYELLDLFYGSITGDLLNDKSRFEELFNIKVTSFIENQKIYLLFLILDSFPTMDTLLDAIYDNWN